MQEITTDRGVIGPAAAGTYRDLSAHLAASHRIWATHTQRYQLWPPTFTNTASFAGIALFAALIRPTRPSYQHAGSLVKSDPHGTARMSNEEDSLLHEATEYSTVPLHTERHLLPPQQCISQGESSIAIRHIVKGARRS